MKRGLAIGIMVAIAVVVGVGAFFGGRASSGTPSPTEAVKVLTNLSQQQRAQLLQNGSLGALFGNRTGTSGTGANRGGGFTAGSIVSKDATSITVKLSDGSTKLVLYSGSTTIGQFTTGTANDLATGKEVTVTGTTNSDGSITATRIQIGALGGGGFPGGSGGTGTSNGADNGAGNGAGTGSTRGGTGPSSGQGGTQAPAS